MVNFGSISHHLWIFWSISCNIWKFWAISRHFKVLLLFKLLHIFLFSLLERACCTIIFATVNYGTPNAWFWQELVAITTWRSIKFVKNWSMKKSKVLDVWLLPTEVTVPYQYCETFQANKSHLWVLSNNGKYLSFLIYLG